MTPGKVIRLRLGSAVAEVELELSFVDLMLVLFAELAFVSVLRVML